MTDKSPTTYIESLGVYLPAGETTSKSRVAGLRSGINIPLERVTGIQSTRRVQPDEFSSDLACRAIESSLRHSRFRPEDIGLVIACNISKYDREGFVFPIEPNTATGLCRKMGFRNAIGFDLSNACAGMFTGILVADCFLHMTDLEAAVVVSGEFISHIADSAQIEISSLFDPRLACLTVGDSGAAAVLARSRDSAIGFQQIDLLTLGAYSSLCRSAPADLAGKGAIMYTDPELLRVGSTELGRHFVRSIHRCGWTPESVDHLIPHQVSKGIPDAIAREINVRLAGVEFPRSKMVDNLKSRGNTATTTHLVALHDHMESQHIGSGERVAFGVAASGLTVGTALYVLDDLPARMRNGAASKERISGEPMPARSVPPEARSVSVASVASTRLRPGIPMNMDQIALEAAELCLENAPCRREDIDAVIFTGVFKGGFLAEPSYASILAGKLFPNATSGPEGHAPLAFDLHHGPNGFLAALEILRTMMGRRGLRAGLFITAEFEDNRLLEGYPRMGLAEVASAAVVMPADGYGLPLREIRFFTFDEFADRFRADAIGISPFHVDFHIGADYEASLRLCIARAIGDYLTGMGRSLVDFDRFYFPQISTEFLDALAEDLSIPRDRIADVTLAGKDLYTSSLPCILEESMKQQPRDGKLCLAVSAGPGINVACALVGRYS